MSMWIISRGVVLLILLMEYKVLRDFLLHRSSINNSARLSNKFGGFYFSFKFDISGLLHHVITTIAYRIRDKDTSQSKQNLQSSSMTFIHKTLIIPSVLDSCFISSTVSEVKRYSANMRRTDADFLHAPPNEYSPSPDDKKQWSLTSTILSNSMVTNAPIVEEYMGINTTCGQYEPMMKHSSPMVMDIPTINGTRTYEPTTLCIPHVTKRTTRSRKSNNLSKANHIADVENTLDQRYSNLYDNNTRAWRLSQYVPLKYIHLGQCSDMCGHYGTLFWNDKTPNSYSKSFGPEYHKCCLYGHVVFNTPQEYPEYIK
ncbi:hypothetical protein Tco_0969323 [Tanacetum coccineum]